MPEKRGQNGILNQIRKRHNITSAGGDDKLNKNPVDSVAVLALGRASESIEFPLKRKGKVTFSGTHKDSTLKVCDKAKSCTY